MVNKILHREEVSTSTDTFAYSGGVTPLSVVAFSEDFPGGQVVSFTDLGSSIQLDEALSIGDYIYMLENTMGYTPSVSQNPRKFTGHSYTFTDLSLFFEMVPTSTTDEMFYLKAGDTSPEGPAVYFPDKIHVGASTGFKIYLNTPIIQRDGPYHDIMLTVEDSGSVYAEYLVNFDYDAVVPSTLIPAEVNLDSNLEVDLSSLVVNPQQWPIDYTLVEGGGSISGSVLTQYSDSVSPVLVNFDCPDLGWSETSIIPLVFLQGDTRVFVDVITGYKKGLNTGNLFLDPSYIDIGSATYSNPLKFSAPNIPGVNGTILHGNVSIKDNFSLDGPTTSASNQDILSGSILNETLPAIIDELEFYKVYLVNLDGSISELRKVGKYVLNECLDYSTPVNLNSLLVVEEEGSLSSDLFEVISGGILELPSWRIPANSIGELHQVTISQYEKLIIRKLSTLWYYNGAAWYTCSEQDMSKRAMPSTLVNSSPQEVWQAIWEEGTPMDFILVNALTGNLKLEGEKGVIDVVSGEVVDAPVTEFLGVTIVDRDSIIWESPVFEITSGASDWVPGVELTGDDPMDMDVESVHRIYQVTSG